MLARRVIGGLALLISLAGPLAATAADDPPGATSCPGCHAVSAAFEAVDRQMPQGRRSSSDGRRLCAWCLCSIVPREHRETDPLPAYARR